MSSTQEIQKGEVYATDIPTAGSLRRHASNPIVSDLMRAVCVPDSLLRTHPEVGAHAKYAPRGENQASSRLTCTDAPFAGRVLTGKQ